MLRKIIIILCLVAIGLSVIIPCLPRGAKAARLVEGGNGRPIIEVCGHQYRFLDFSLEKEMFENGIPIPLEKRDEYNGLAVVRPDSIHFMKAFLSLYVPSCYNREKIEWVDADVEEVVANNSEDLYADSKSN
ncbi:MAG: hypothetical protein S4CHLAM102_11150 [Chlamydiia bacterium]|nr:hypothetical protein [Chlamydiia bacterium]